MPTPFRYVDASVVRICDHSEQEDHLLVDDLTRFGPEVAGVNSIPGFWPTTKNILPSSRLSHRRIATCLTVTASPTSSECDVEESENGIELSVIHALAPGDDTLGSRSFTHTRTTSASTFTSFSSSSSPSRPVSECECVHEEEIGTGSADRASLNHDENAPAHCASEDVRREDEVKAASALSLGVGEAEHSTSSETPMSPRQKPYTHRIYVPLESHHDRDRKRVEASEEAGLQSLPLQASYNQSADSDHPPPGETDTLLPVRTNDGLTTLPFPATTARGDEPMVFKFSFSSIETSLHVAGVSVTAFLIVISVWLTLANVVM